NRRSKLIAQIVEIKVARIEVPTISVGETDPYCILIAITFVGINVTLEVFNAKKVIIESDATGEASTRFISSIAFSPIGVASVPRPNKFAVKLDKIDHKTDV